MGVLKRAGFKELMGHASFASGIPNMINTKRCMIQKLISYFKTHGIFEATVSLNQSVMAVNLQLLRYV